MKSPLPITMWAVIVKSARSQWIHWTTLDRTRKGAWEKYKAEWLPEYRHRCEEEKRTGKVRLARVDVAERRRNAEITNH